MFKSNASPEADLGNRKRIILLLLTKPKIGSE